VAEWTWVLIPAVVAALAIRVDAKLIGPYFSFPSLVYGWEGLDGENWYEDDTRRWAVTRRLFYPFLLGVVLALSGLQIVDIGAAGFITAGLLLWPAVFHGLPYGVSKRDWEVPVLYALIFVLFTALAAAGWYLVQVVESAATGGVWSYMAILIRDWLVTLLIVGFLAAFFKGAFLSLRRKKQAREALGQEYDFDGGSEFLDAPPTPGVD
jgi:hypothetical protein